MRASGILMHITSLPSKYGIGTMGAEAYKFVDFLVEAKQRYWQILPVGPTSYGDSPYQSFSTHAGNPYMIDLDMLAEDGLLEEDDYAKAEWGADPEKVDYEQIYHSRYKVLRKAYEKFKIGDKTDFNRFVEENDNWISNYALFMSAKILNNNKSWLEWADGLKTRDPHTLWEFKTANADEVEFWEFIQYKFFEQWRRLKSYANEKGILIIGDIPIYVALDSAPVWVYPDLFELDGKLAPTKVAGCPPDSFSPTGQLWGNPLYRWGRHEETGYNWWIDRLAAARELYDVIRIDHFRGFDEYYAVPFGDTTAENGEWLKGPSLRLFEAVEAKLGRLNVIAEDLGFLTPSVREMLKKSGYPGMKVLEFAFDSGSDNDYLPHKFVRNSAAYIGTHDNDTVLGWLDTADESTVDFCAEYIMADKKNKSDFLWRLIGTVFASVSDTAILQMQDCLELGSEARMNIPSTSGSNWTWRMKKGAATKDLAARLADITRTYGRDKN